MRKIDRSFDKWKDNAQKRDDAVALGKKANQARMAYEKDKTNDELKRSYKDANKQYEKALRKNTTYRKGQIKREVGQDISRKYLSEAKRVKKLMDRNPSDRNLKNDYDRLMSKHDVERANARRAERVAAKRSTMKANLKRTATMTVKAAATTTAIAAGAYVVNRYMNDHQTTIKGRRVHLSERDISSVIDMAKKAKSAMGYFY